MVFDLFSKRMRIERGEVPEVYTYDTLPQPLRVQITYLFDQAFALGHLSNDKAEIYRAIAQILREERGVYKLSDSTVDYPYFNGRWDCEEEVKKYFLRETKAEHALDVMELFFRVVYKLVKDRYSYANLEPAYEKVIERLNIRFKEHGVGYSFQETTLIRVDSEAIHQTIVKPALKLLHDKNYKNAEDEYLNAHEHYRNVSLFQIT